jgi:predicted dehydrogenase
MSEGRRLRAGVVGGGLIAQAAHLPNLRRLASRFDLVALADPSARIRDAMAVRFAPLRTFERWEDMVAGETLDCVVVCSPHATHKHVTLAALDAGLHVLVEKPLCMNAADAATIATAASDAARVVMVGYMKRYDPAVRAAYARVAADAQALRFVDVVTYDPWMARAPFFRDDELVRAEPPSAAESESLSAAESEQVEAAIGRADPAAVKAFGYVYLACLIHDVNLVHGALERGGVELPLEPVSAGHWADGRAASVAWRLPAGGRWHCTWLLLEGLDEFRESVSFYAPDAVHRLTFPAPYLRQASTVLETIGARAGTTVRSVERALHESYMAELEHFHDCIVAGVPCETPPEQARVDIEALQRAFPLAAPSP